MRLLSLALRAIRCANVRFGILPAQSSLRWNDEQELVQRIPHGWAKKNHRDLSCRYVVIRLNDHNPLQTWPRLRHPEVSACRGSHHLNEELLP
jgi:hypothetical protein